MKVLVTKACICSVCARATKVSATSVQALFHLTKPVCETCRQWMEMDPVAYDNAQKALDTFHSLVRS